MADLKTISPVDGSLYAERPLASATQLDTILGRAAGAQEAWARTPLTERCEICATSPEARPSGCSPSGTRTWWFPESV